MRSPHIRLNALAFAMLFTLAVAGITYVIIKSLNEWRDNIVETNKVLTKVVVEQLNKSATQLLDSLNRKDFFLKDTFTKNEKDELDNRLKKISSEIFSKIDGVEGGIYLTKYDEFLGYSYPTSPPPIPAYGPPPRSYEIIRTQILESINQMKQIIKLHQFDPAIFPLATEPAIIDGKTVGAVWTRIHIERELPVLKLNEILNIAAAIAILGFIIAVVVSIRLKKRIDHIRMGLENIQKDPSYRFEALPGVFGFIGISINKMVKALTDEHTRAQQLEKDLHQQDKMAVLGKLIAGVAHEVKTPLAIIKTRIQMWQRGLKNAALQTESISEESMKLVVNEIDRLSKLVKRLLVFSKPISSKLQKIDLNKLVNSTLNFFRDEKNSSDISYSFSLDENVPLILADINGLEQVFINILTNSVEAMSGGGRLHVQTKFYEKDKSIEIKISDTGKGIAEEIHSKIFDPFYTTKDYGTGLGLSIAHEIIKAHKGEIEFINENGWTTCKIILPVNSLNSGEAHEKQ